jgi:formylglycine-generating enzyme required for sulfatase activity
MVRVPAGEFRMGSDTQNPDERPLRTVRLDAFWVDRYEVTNSQYRDFVTRSGHRAPYTWEDGRLNGSLQPVVGVDWYDAQVYCAWAGKRLCTEAEWEKAARGTDGRSYPWGDEEPGTGRANYDMRIGRPVDVGSYPEGASPYGPLDMAGNVWEWVADWYGRDYYRDAPARNPKGPESGTIRVYRGGSWANGAVSIVTTKRGRLDPTARGDQIGFRCCR